MGECEQYLSEAGILPHEDLVLRVAVGGDQLAGVLGPRQIADLDIEMRSGDFSVCSYLTAGVDALHGLPGERVPEPDVPVRRPAPAG